MFRLIYRANEENTYKHVTYKLFDGGACLTNVGHNYVYLFDVEFDDDDDDEDEDDHNDINTIKKSL